MRILTHYAGSLAIVAALAGCSADPAGKEPGEPASQPASQPTTTAAASASPGSAGPSGSQLPAEHIEAVLLAIDEAESLNAQVTPDAELRALQEEGVRKAKEITVTPEECNVYTASGLEGLTVEATRAAMTFAGESSLQPDTISLSSLPSAETALAQLQASRSQLDACSRFTMEVSGQKITVNVAGVDVETAAGDEIALRTTARIPGTIQESLTVRAVVGSTVVDVLVGGSTDPEADVARAERLTDLVVSELRLH